MADDYGTPEIFEEPTWRTTISAKPIVLEPADLPEAETTVMAPRKTPDPGNVEIGPLKMRGGYVFIDLIREIKTISPMWIIVFAIVFGCVSFCYSASKHADPYAAAAVKSLEISNQERLDSIEERKAMRAQIDLLLANERDAIKSANAIQEQFAEHRQHQDREIAELRKQIEELKRTK